MPRAVPTYRVVVLGTVNRTKEFFARQPGLQVVVPSTPEDAAGLTWSAIHGADPVIVLLPKHLLWTSHKPISSAEAIPIGEARKQDP